MLRILLLVVSISCCFEITAQRNTPILWSTPIGFNFQWMHLSPEGTLVVGSGDSTVVGLDQKTGAVKWTFKASRGALITGVDPIRNVPYLQLRGVALTIIDPGDGHVVINSDAAGITHIYKYGFLYQSGHLWLDAVIGGGRGLSVFELATGKKLWTRSDYFAGPDKSGWSGAKTLYNASMELQAPTLLGAPINRGNDQMIFGTGDHLSFNNLFCVKIDNGDVVWRTEAPDPNKNKLIKVEVDTSFFRFIAGPRRFFFVRANWMTACSYDDGKPTWANPVKTGGKVGKIIYDSRGMILCSSADDVEAVISTGHFRLVDEETGVELWREQLKFNGGISKYEYTEKGLAVVTENNESGLTNINFIDVANGKYILSNPYHLAGKIHDFQVTPKGVYYSTDRSVNIIADDGKQLIGALKNNIIQGGLPTVNGNDKAYAYYNQDQNLYEIDKDSASSKVLNKDKIDFKGLAAPHHVEIRKDGIMLYSDQNITFVNFDGTTRYLIHYKSVWNWYDKGEAFINLFTATLDAAMSLYGEALQAQQQLSQPGLTVDQKTAISNNYDQSMQAQAEVGTAKFVNDLKAFNEIKLRLRATKSAGDIVAIATTIKKHPAGQALATKMQELQAEDLRDVIQNNLAVLAIVNKDTGELLSKIDLQDRDEDPVYEIDVSSGILFLTGKNVDSIQAFNIR